MIDFQQPSNNTKAIVAVCDAFRWLGGSSFENTQDYRECMLRGLDECKDHALDILKRRKNTPRKR